MKSINNTSSNTSVRPWSFLVEGDEQLDRPNSQTTWNYAMHQLHNFLGFNTNTTALILGRSSLHLLLKSSMVRHIGPPIKIAFTYLLEDLIFEQNFSYTYPKATLRTVLL